MPDSESPPNMDESLLNDLGNLLLFYFRDEFYKVGVEAARKVRSTNTDPGSRTP